MKQTLFAPVLSFFLLSTVTTLADQLPNVLLIMKAREQLRGD